ncbi:hypothetical protein [Neorhizobium sp. P12A]|jgi:hypothetical protein|uniref:hypothetical protein n=1 Tax=Neorhizobium sp. P12A TaxID=2268027 RepID=UPI0011EC0CAF|nr:hypothetical protein [Neorhizobium sp. P12A]
MSKITNGLNDRPKDASIAPSGPGIPDDSGAAVDASEKEIERVRRKLQDDESPADTTKREREKERPSAHGAAR